ncbi:hypothetical protein JL09_g6724 [Pichia kudriavzevii]|uniref:Uncharacterized protein n=1 Tax=Pichia kudriavzevii TaxID=4909 RepID=A0A099NKN9_PICKU|nr:hypothetical protein JL09_g6724 [Pichia kudriavzevii]
MRHAEFSSDPSDCVLMRAQREHNVNTT